MFKLSNDDFGWNDESIRDSVAKAWWHFFWGYTNLDFYTDRPLLLA